MKFNFSERSMLDSVVPTKSPIPIPELVKRGFNESDVKAMNLAVPNGNYPWLFENPNIIYVDRMVIDIADYDDDSELERWTSQKPRVGPNTQYSAIRADIVGSGYSLHELPPAVRRIKTDHGYVYPAIDGRTRAEILESEGVKQIIVDVFDIDDECEFIRLSQLYNRWHKPYGEGSTADIESTIRMLEDNGAFKWSWSGGLKNMYCKSNEKLRNRMKVVGEVLTEECINLSNNKLTENQISQIISKVQNDFHTDGKKMVRKFNNGGKIKTFLQKEFKIYCKTDTIEVIPFSGSPGLIAGVLETILSRREWLSQIPDRQLHFVFYSGKPNPVDLEGSWKRATIEDMKSRWDDLHSYISYDHFDKGQVRLLGAIPQIRSLDKGHDAPDSIPMDRLFIIDPDAFLRHHIPISAAA